MRRRVVVGMAVGMLLALLAPVPAVLAQDVPGSDDLGIGTAEETGSPSPSPSPTSTGPLPIPIPAPSSSPGPAAPVPEGAVAFDPALDRSSWYWTKQVDQEAGAGPVAQRVRLRNPQSADTLPVSVEDGKPEKNSAILFGLADRGMPPGSTITSFVLHLQEGKPGPEFPSYNATDRMIQACKIGDFWPTGEAELWETMPPIEDGACVDGARQAPAAGSTDPTYWVFDVTPLAAEWGLDPFQNHGLMLVGVPKATGPSESWQINLKIPARDNAATPNNEYEESKGRAYIEVAFQPGAAPTTGGPSLPPPPTDGDGFGSGSDFGSGGDLGGGGSSFDSTGDLDGSTDFDSTGGTATEQPSGFPVSLPKMPWYVWILLPLALAAAAAVRMSLLEGTVSTRPDGVIAAIRRRTEPGSPSPSDRTGP